MKTKKKPAKKAAKKAVKKSKEKVLGKVEHIFEKIHVITTTLKAPMKTGDIIHIKGHTTDFCQPVASIQIEHASVAKAKKGDGIGIKVEQTVRDTDIIYLADKKTAAAYKSAVLPAQPVKAPPRQQVFNPITPAFQPKPSVQMPQKPRAVQPPDTKPKFMSF